MRAHGTLERYWTGCGCADCLAAGTRTRGRPRKRRALVERTAGIAPGMIRSHTLPTGELSVECWCRGSIVYVDPSVVRACRTDTCGAPGCAAPEEAA